jgi:hypothetical protein
MPPRVSWLALGLTCAHAAWAGPPTMVHTKDGSVFYGELVERVAKDHVTIILATGVVKRIKWDDVDEAPLVVTPPKQPEPVTPAPTETVRTKDGSVYYGEVIERQAGHHVTLKLETGATKTIEDADIDTDPPPPPAHVVREPAPVINVRTSDGSIYHGEVVESVAEEHITLKLATGALKTIEWEDLWRPHAPPPRPKPKPHVPRPNVEMGFLANDARAVLQQRGGTDDGFTDVCATPCRRSISPDADYRVILPFLTETSPFKLTSAHDNQIVATIRPKGRLYAGIATAVVSAPLAALGLGLGIAASNAPTYQGTSGGYFLPVDNTALAVTGVVFDVLAPIVLGAGVALIVASLSSVKINDVLVTRF